MKAIVTGATGAIGMEIARALAEKGHDLILACRSEKRGDDVGRMIEMHYGIVPEIVSLDLSDPESVRRAAERIARCNPDILINNAGVMNPRFRIDDNGVEDTLNVNYHNTRLLSELLLPAINPGGCIVFTTSATRYWYPLQKLSENISSEEFGRLKTYALSKKLITRFAATLADDPSVKGRHIRVNCTDPGIVDTPMLSMGRWFDPLTDIFFRPFCLKPATAARTAIKAAESDLSGYIFLSPCGKLSNRKKL